MKQELEKGLAPCPLCCRRDAPRVICFMCGGTGQVRAEAASTLILLVQGNARPPYYQIMLKLRAIDPTFIHESYRAIELKPRRTP